MKNLFTKSIFTIALSALALSCQEASVEQPIIVPSEGISFSSSIGTKATDTEFESGDEIGVTAFSDVALTQVYADNVAYQLGAAGLFQASGEAISYPSDGSSLIFRAIYPLQGESYSDEFTFSVEADQSDYDNYTLSDLMTATTEATVEEVPELIFSHRLSRVVVQVTSDAILDGAVVKFLNVLTDASVNLSEDTYEGVGETGEVTLYDNGDYSYKAILAPQSFKEGIEFVSVEYQGVTYTTALEGDALIQSGKQYFFGLELDVDSGALTFTTDINPWEDDDFYKFVIFTDENFEAAVFAVSTDDITSPGYDGNIPQQIDANGDGRISYDEAAAVTQIGATSYECGNFEGLEHFTSLEVLYAYFHNASVIDVTNCPELRILDLHSYKADADISVLDLSQNTKLEWLSVQGQDLEGLDLSNNIVLKYLDTSGGYNSLGAVDLTKNTLLETADISSSEVTTINLSGCSKLEYLNCSSNSVESLDITGCSALEDLCVSGSTMTSLVLSDCPNLLTFTMDTSTGLTTVDLSKNTLLDSFYARYSSLSEIDFSNNTALRQVSVVGARLSKMDVTMMNSSGYIYCGRQKDGDETVIKENTVTFTQEQIDNKEFFSSSSYDNEGVVVVIASEEEPDEPSDVVITTTLAAIPTDGSVGAGVWVITDSYGFSSSNFTSLKTAVSLAGGEVSLEFPNINKLPTSALGVYPTNAEMNNLVSIKLDVATTIAGDALTCCVNLREIYAPNVTTIEEYALDGLDGLETITICTSASSASIDDGAFGSQNQDTVTLIVGNDTVTGGVTEVSSGGDYSWKSSSSAAAIYLKEVIFAD